MRTDGCWATAYIGVYLQEKRETMNASTHFDALNLLMLPDGQVCQLDDDFLLADNLGISMPLSDLSVDPYTNLFVKSPYPFRIQFVMLLACTGGFMRFRLHLKEYVLRENDLDASFGPTWQNFYSAVNTASSNPGKLSFAAKVRDTKWA